VAAETDPALLVAERELEFEAIDRGIARYKQYRAANAGNGKPEQMLASQALDAVTAKLTALRDKVLAQEIVAAPGLNKWGPALMYFPPDMLAACGLVTMIATIVKHHHSASKPMIRQDPIRKMGDAVETMFHLLQAKDMDKDLYNILRKSIKAWDSRQARRFYKKVTGLNRAWDLQTRLHVGGLLYSTILSETGWFHEQGTRDGIQVRLDGDVLAELERAHEQMELLSPFQYPMVVKPAHWGQGGKRGGYIYHNYDIFKPVNAGDRPPKLNDSQPVYDCMNALQDTGWQINRGVYPVMQAVWDAGGGWAGVPLKRKIIDKTTGPRAADNASEAEIKAAKKVRAELWDKEAEEISPRLAMLYRMSVAQRMQSFDAFHYVYQMDWRGRLYPIAAALSPQGDDMDRGLLTFSEAVPQTDEGRRWLAIHAANSWANDGLDKAPFPERVAWVASNAEAIKASARNPLDHKWWAQAENPWQFLAACMELTRTDGLTQLPVAVDGSCNGLQHYSAIGLDPIGGAAVNLLASDRPSDIYSLVAAQVATALALCIERPPLPPIKRKLVKRGVMTLPYGLTPIGMRDQFISDGHMDGLPDPYASATFLRDLTWTAIGQVVVKAMEYMGWLKLVASAANEHGTPLQWTVPTGMQVTQDYVIPQNRRYDLPGIGELRFAYCGSAVRELNKTKQSNGICPNYIHSYDAAHLMLTVCACIPLGLTAFQMIHDSYGTHAPRVPILSRVLREQFVLMYEKENPLERFKQDTEQRLGLQLPDLPPRGSLDLRAVLSSPYFFA
jgi:DNA-directed RNA polymerase